MTEARDDFQGAGRGNLLKHTATPDAATMASKGAARDRPPDAATSYSATTPGLHDLVAKRSEWQREVYCKTIRINAPPP